jgi:hypothetical protein
MDVMKKLLIGMLAVIWSVSALSYSTDRDLFVEVTSSVNPSSGNVTETMYGTLAYENAHEDNSYTAVYVSTSGYLYFQARDHGKKIFSMYTKALCLQRKWSFTEISRLHLITARALK